MDTTSTPSRERDIYRVTLAGSLINVLLVVCKFIAGMLGHSAAMIADAVHSLSDLITDIVVIVFVRIAGKPEDKGHDYGHGKYETIATLLIGMALLAVAIGICKEGIEQIIAYIQGKVLESPGWIALGAALLSILPRKPYSDIPVRWEYGKTARRLLPMPGTTGVMPFHPSVQLPESEEQSYWEKPDAYSTPWQLLWSVFSLHGWL